jgi:hypothetical protein
LAAHYVVPVVPGVDYLGPHEADSERPWVPQQSEPDELEALAQACRALLQSSPD